MEEIERGGEGVSLRGVSKKYNIPVTTLHDHLHGKSKRVGAGAPTVLSPREEQEIVLSCQVLTEMGFGLTKELVEVIVVDYIRENRKVALATLRTELTRF